MIFLANVCCTFDPVMRSFVPPPGEVDKLIGYVHHRFSADGDMEHLKDEVHTVGIYEGPLPLRCRVTAEAIRSY